MGQRSRSLYLSTRHRSAGCDPAWTACWCRLIRTGSCASQTMPRLRRTCAKYWKNTSDGTRGSALACAKTRSEEHTSELQSLMRNSYAVFCLKKKTYQHKAKTNVAKIQLHNILYSIHLHIRLMYICTFYSMHSFDHTNVLMSKITN